MTTLADLYTAVQKHLAADLINTDYQERIAAIAQRLPVTRTAGFECRLTQAAAQADFLVAFDLEDLYHAIAMNPALFNEAVHEFMEQWLHPASPLHTTITHSWFEFDIFADQAVPLRPGILFCNLIDTPERQSIIQHSLELLLNHAISPDLQSQLDHYFTALLPETYVFAFGIMVARSIKAVRLCTHHLSLQSVCDFMARLGWTGALDEVIHLLTPIAAHIKYIRLSVDLTEAGIYPRLGFDLHLDEAKRPRFSADWEQALAYLVAQGYCLPDKSEALRQWAGQGYVDLNFPGVVYRALSHLKINYQPGQPLNMKAYFGFTYIRLNAIVTFYPPPL